jgi:dihydroorotate dehydrogenase (NAD+) catalytic subunit
MGIGGIASIDDVMEFLVTGATAVQVGSAHFIDARAGLKIVDGIQQYLRVNDIPNLTDLIGSLKVRRDSGPGA